MAPPHRRLLATAALVGTVLLSFAPLCAAAHQQPAHGRAAVPAAPLVRGASALEQDAKNAIEEFGSRPVPEGLSEVAAKRPVSMEEEEGSVGRRKLMWWNWVINGLGPDPLHTHSSGGSGGGGGSSSSGGSSGSGSGGGSGSGSGSGSDGSGGGGGNANSSSSGNHSVSSRVSDFFNVKNTSMWMMLVAGAAVCAAIAAVVIGQRKTEDPPSHALKGSVNKRMKLFGNFADRALCSTVDRPCGRMVEMSSPPTGAPAGDDVYKEMV